MRPWEREPQETPPPPPPPPASSPPSSSPVPVKFSVSSLVVKPSDSVAGGSDFEPGELHAAGSRIRDEFPSSPLRPRSHRFHQESGRGIRAGSVSPIHQRGSDHRYDRGIDNSEAEQHGREIWGGMDNGKFRDHSPTYGHERERYRDLSPTYGRGRGGDRLRDFSPPHGRGRGGDRMRDFAPPHGRGRGTERFQNFSPTYGRGRGRGRGRGSFRDISPPFGLERGGRSRDISPPYGRGRGRGRFRDLSPPSGRGVGRGRFRDLSPPSGRGVGRGRFRDLSPPYGRGVGRGRFRDLSPTFVRDRYRDFSPLSDHKRGGPGRGGFHEPSLPYGSSKGGGKFRDLSPPYDRERGGRSLERGHEEPEPELLPIRGESENRNDPNLSPRVGDWICRNPLCGNLNFSRRDYCNNCNKFRYMPGEVVPDSSPRRSYSGPPPPHQSPPRRPGLPAGRGMRRDVNGYRSPPHGWAREDPGDPPSPRHGERFLSRPIRRGRPDYDEGVDYREMGKFEKPMPYELDYRDHRRDESISERRGPPLSPSDRWISRERSRSPVRDKSMNYRRGSFVGRGRGGRWSAGRGRNDRY